MLLLLLLSLLVGTTLEKAAAGIIPDPSLAQVQPECTVHYTQQGLLLPNTRCNPDVTS